MERRCLEIEALCKSYEGVAAVQDVSLSVREGEIVGLIGPNGAGKTTLFNLLTGITQPDSGEVVFMDRKITGKPQHYVASTGISRTFQDVRLARSMTVLENVLLFYKDQPGESIFRAFFHWKTCKKREDEITRSAMSLLQSVGLENKATDPADELSYGQQKLLSIACCLAGNAPLMLLDEPVAGVAPVMIERILSVVTALPNAGKTIVIIEHNIDVIMRICNKVVFMDAGRKISEGSPEEVRNDPKVIEAYLH